jgi:6-phosphogluconolactonase
MLLYIGTCTKASGRGIYSCRFQPDTSRLTAVEVAAETANPSFLALHPTGRFLYAVNELNPNGGVSAFSVNGSGALTALNRVASRGADPCYLEADRTGRCLMVANYTSGGVAAFPLRPDGTLGEASSFSQHRGKGPKTEQDGPHVHQARLSPDQRFVLSPDLGADRLILYRLLAERAELEPHGAVEIVPGSGPRHVAFHPNGRFLYLINELGCTVMLFDYDGAAGTMRSVETVSTLPPGWEGRADSAEIQVHPGGRFLYASNRFQDSIAVFAIDSRGGTLTLVEHVSSGGKIPRHFAIDPTGAYVLAANQDSGNIVVFRIDAATGRLTPAGPDLAVPSPVCILFAA